MPGPEDQSYMDRLDALVERARHNKYEPKAFVSEPGSYPGYAAEQVARRIRHEFLTTASDIPQSKSTPHFREQQTLVSLVRELDSLVGNEQLLVIPREQEESFVTGMVDTGCYDRAVVYVRYDLPKVFADRPDSIREEYLYHLTHAVMVDGGMSRIGDFTSLGQVRGVLDTYLLTLDESAPLTASQLHRIAQLRLDHA